MRRLRFYIIILLAFIWFLILLPYFLVQTSFGAKIVSQQLSKLSPYSISIGGIHHSFSNFYELVFDDVVVSDEKQEIVNLSNLVIGFDKDNLWQLNHFNYISIIDGVINDSNINHYNISANNLRFFNATIQIPINQGRETLLLKEVKGRIKPFTSSGKDNYQFDLTSQQVLFNETLIDSVLIQGFVRDGITTVTNLGGNVGGGFFVSKLKILADESLDIDQLRVSNIHFQVTDDEYLNKLSDVLPDLTIRHFSLFGSSLQFPSFSMENSDLEVNNVSYDKQQQWHFNESSLVFNADIVKWHDESFNSVLIKLKTNEEEVQIEKAIATWNKGNVNLTGTWRENQLQLEQLTLVDVDYQLPEKLDRVLLPDVFSLIKIDQLTVLPSLFISTRTDYPFLFINFEVSGSDITIVKNRKLGLYSGTLFFKAERGSVNEVNIKYPDLVVKFDSNNHPLLNFSTLISDGGMVEALATLDPSQTEFLSLRFNAYNITSSLLHDWKLVKQPPMAINYTADLHGSISPFALSGRVTIDNNNFIVTPQY